MRKFIKALDGSIFYFLLAIGFQAIVFHLTNNYFDISVFSIDREIARLLSIIFLVIFVFKFVYVYKDLDKKEEKLK